MLSPLWSGLLCKCPRCGEGDFYKRSTYLKIQETCPVCGLALAKNDSGDGPAVFLIFVLGFLLMPLALLVEVWFSPPLWVHAVIWTLAALGITLGSLRPLKAFIIALQFKYRPDD